ncbi:MAG: SPFH domain-containing protein [Candidatus Diapherotrites archaeon]|nr:SPFH domain-containing protein [Candidatus Diapherotrites archaeon]
MNAEHNLHESPNSGHTSYSGSHSSTSGKKNIVFLGIITVLIIAVVGIVFFEKEIMENSIWLVLLAAFVLILWKGRFVLTLEEYERAVISRFGRVARVGGPGWTFLLPLIEKAHTVDLRTQVIDLEKQDVITKDSIELKVDAVIYLRVGKSNEDILNSVIAVQDYKEAARLYIISSIRNKGGSLTLPEIIANIDQFNTELKLGLAKLTKQWGVEVQAVEVKDVDIPKIVLDAMHAEKAAVQERLARLEKAKAHQGEIEAVKESTANLSESTMAYYYVKALEQLSKGKSTKFIFPLELSRIAENLSGKVSSSSSSGIKFNPADIEPYKALLMTYVEEAVQKAKEKENKKEIKLEASAEVNE